MLVIRLQRVGRKGHAQFRVVVQDSRRTPSSGRIVASLGHYNPHTKEILIEKDKAQHYLKNGAQPSNKVANLLKQNGVKLPSWVKLDDPKQRKTRNPEKLRRNLPTQESEEVKKDNQESTNEVEPKAEAENDDATPVGEKPTNNS
jgi:small subunit ribosomal protein S16